MVGILRHVRACRMVIDGRFPGVPASGAGLEHLRVALYSTERGVAELTSPARGPDWIRQVGDDVAGSMTETLERLAIALTNVDDIQPLAIVAGDAQALREQTAIRTLSAAAAVITLGAAEMIAAWMSQAQAAAREPELRSPPACRTRSSGYSPWP